VICRRGRLLTAKPRYVEVQNGAMRVRADLDGQAAQLPEHQKYTSEFLANMSHDLRTPLNRPADPLQSARRETRRALRPSRIEFS